MVKTTRSPILAVLAIGLGLGFVASNDGLNLFKTSQASAAAVYDEPPSTLTDAACPASSCCEGIGRSSVLAAVSAHNTEVSAKAAQEGKKPNILFIMGD